MLPYALTIFTGAFLLFQVQPLIGKYILPWFGGGPGVWTTCMLFFQIVLLGGYAYAHLITKLLRPRWQVIVHVVLLLGSLAVQPITPSEAWKPTGDAEPVGRILLLLAASLGLPYFMLSATGPLMQQWFSRTSPGTSPYRLYALSNVGSLLALLSYPFFFETQFTRQQQAVLWGWGLVAYALFAGWCAWLLWKRSGSEPVASEVPVNAELPDAGSTVGQRVLWLLLPACASVLLLATTNKMCQDVAVIPFLWVLPLALYLLSFIIAFDSPRWYARPPYAVALVAGLVGVTWALFEGTDAPLKAQVGIYCGALFVFCMICHGELYRLRPHPSRLTGFYLMISAGGALGGLFVALAAPLLFVDFLELHWGLTLCAVLFAAVCFRDRLVSESKAGRWLAIVATVAGMFGVISLIVHLNDRHLFVSGKVLSRILSALSSIAVMGALGAIVIGLKARFRGWVLVALCFAVVAATVGGLFGIDPLIAYLKASSAPAEFRSISPTRWFRDLLISHRAGIVDAVRLVLIWSATGYVLLQTATGPMKRVRAWRWVTLVWMIGGTVALGWALTKQASEDNKTMVHRSRNFYGTLAVTEHSIGDPDAHHFILQHGRITHGLQFTDPEKAKVPTSYYGHESGIGMALDAFTNDVRHVGVIGLGTGSITSHGKPGDRFRLYEINSAVTALATSRFTYLKDSAATTEIVLGDARLSMEREAPQQFDVLALDAFSSDAIPVHLLTKEAIALYGRHMKTNGIIAVHISNRYLDLEPVVLNLAKHHGYSVATIEFDDEERDESSEESAWWFYSSTWMLLSHDEELLQRQEIQKIARKHKKHVRNIPLWTDDFASLFQVLE